MQILTFSKWTKEATKKNSFYWKISHSKCVDNDDDDAANETTRCWAYVQKRSFSISLQQTIVYLDNIRPYWWHMHNEKWNQNSLYHLYIFLCAFCNVFSTSGAFVREGHAYFKTQVIKIMEERLTSRHTKNLEPIEDRSTGINCIISKVNIGSLAVPFEQWRCAIW